MFALKNSTQKNNLSKVKAVMKDRVKEWRQLKNILFFLSIYVNTFLEYKTLSLNSKASSRFLDVKELKKE